MTDHNNMEDLEQGDVGHESEGFAQAGMRANLANAWRTQPMVKLLALVLVVGAVVGITISLFSGGPNADRKNGTSMAGVPNNIHEAPGGKASEYVKEETRLANEQREKDALNKGTSSMPTPIGADTESKKDDPLNELRAEIENLTKEVNRPKPAAAPPAPAPVIQQQAVQQPEQFDEGLSKAMQKQMGDLMNDWKAHTIKVVAVSKGTAGGADPNQPAAAAGAPGASSASASGDGSSAAPPPKMLIPAGTISYAKLLTEANSDVPGPILAQIVSGPLNGARAIGKFQVENAYTDYLVLRFTLAELNGKEYQINTLAIDPDTSLGAMATDVDERYFERVFLPAAASFVEALGSALSTNNSSVTSTGTTTITTQGSKGFRQGIYQGIGSAGQTVSQFLQNQANQTKPLVVVAAGTPMGLLFVTSVKDAPSPVASQGRNPRGTLIGQQQQAPIGLAGYSSPDSSLSVDGGATGNNGNGGNYTSGYGSQGNSTFPFALPTAGTMPATIYNPSAYSNLLPGYGTH